MLQLLDAIKYIKKFLMLQLLNLANVSWQSYLSFR